MTQLELDGISNKIKVKSMTNPDVEYEIDLVEKTCTCMAFKKSGKKKKCKHLIAQGIIKEPEIKYPAKPAYSQAVSAYIKETRLRNFENAIYWLWYIFNTMPDSRWRLYRRAWIMAAEDGNNVHVQMLASKWFNNCGTITPQENLMKMCRLTHLICQTPNWWSDKTAYPYLYESYRAEQSHEEFPTYDLETNMNTLIGYCVTDKLEPHERFYMASIYLYKIEPKMSAKDKEYFGNRLYIVAKEHGLEDAAKVFQCYLVSKGKDWNYSGQGIYRLCGNELGQEVEFVSDQQFINDTIEVVRERWRHPLPVPAYCCDGIHCSGKDRRFAGMLPSMLSCILAYHKFGRLSPDDSWSVLYKALDKVKTYY